MHSNPRFVVWGIALGVAALCGCSYDWAELEPSTDGATADRGVDAQNDAAEDSLEIDVASDRGTDAKTDTPGHSDANADAGTIDGATPSDASSNVDVATDTAPIDSGPISVDTSSDASIGIDGSTPVDAPTGTDAVDVTDMGATVDTGPPCVSSLCPCGSANLGGYCGIGGTCNSSGVCVGSPVAGSLIITEFINWTHAVYDDPGEWLEVYNPGASPVDLRGMRLGNSRSQYTVLAGAQPVIVAPTGWGLIARNGDPTMNGGLPPATYVLNLPYDVLTFGDASGTITLDMGGGTPLIDSVTYDSVTWPNDRGYAKSLRPGVVDPLQRAMPSNWCDAPTQWPGSLGDYGSPGTVNPPCP